MVHYLMHVIGYHQKVRIRQTSCLFTHHIPNTAIRPKFLPKEHHRVLNSRTSVRIFTAGLKHFLKCARATGPNNQTSIANIKQKIFPYRVLKEFSLIENKCWDSCMHACIQTCCSYMITGKHVGGFVAIIPCRDANRLAKALHRTESIYNTLCGFSV